MFGNYLKIAIRHILRYKGHSFIKIFGLSIGIAACMFIYLFVADELSFDKFHKNGDHLFRFVQIQIDKGSVNETGLQQYIPTPVGPELIQSIPQVRYQTRYVNGSGVVRYKGEIFRETLTMVDSPFFEMFTFPLIAGDPRTALSDEHSIVLSQSHAEKYFGQENPLSKTVTITYGHTKRDYMVTGVAEDVPPNSSINFDILIHFHNLPIVLNNPQILNNWNRWYCPLFVQLQPNVTSEQVAGRLDQFCQQHYSSMIQRYIDEGHNPFTFGLQRVKDMHLDTRVVGTAGLSTSYLLSAIALAILLIACVNFMNLSIGSSSVRSTEVGMRKVLGAGRRQLLLQFWGEALVISLLAILMGFVMTEFLIPKFNALSGKQLSLLTLFEGGHWTVLLGIAFFSGIFAGSYPALVMSAFRPADILKGKLKAGGRTTLTKGLVILQFTLAVILGISAVILGKQVSFMINSDPGYVSEGLVVIMTQENEPQESESLYHRFRNEVISHNRIQGLSASNREFGLFLPGASLELGERKINYRYNRVDPDFLSTMKFKLIQGRDFSPNIAADKDTLIVNQKFKEMLGSDLVMGKPLGDISKGFPYDRRVIGVIEDCHYESLRNEIQPLILYVGEGTAPRRNRFSRIIVRVETEQIKNTMAFLENVWEKTQPDKPFITYFQDDALDSLYNQEKRWSAIIQYASVVSILLACLGIFGLTSITLSRRIKEIGIRKVLGASVGQIVYLATRQFVFLISIANVIAWPVVFIIMKRVLQNYPYRIDITIHYFVLAWVASVFIAVLTIFYLSLKAAMQDPVESLRYE
ncbi:MAG: ABC transporter permease [Candidatus Aminicenantes bacterium]|nr:MAG: ABC transporter permease [Candidatus Aminicenantes bacterium]